VGAALQSANTRNPTGKAEGLECEPAIDGLLRFGPPYENRQYRQNGRETEEGDLGHEQGDSVRSAENHNDVGAAETMGVN